MKVIGLSSLFGALALVGCTTAHESAGEAFLSGVGNERANYVRVYEVSAEALKEQEDRILRISDALVHGAREASGGNTNESRALLERLDRIEMIAHALNAANQKQLDDLARACDPKKDSILFFHYRSDSREELGFLITCGRTVKRKMTFGTDFEDEPGGEPVGGPNNR